MAKSLYAILKNENNDSEEMTRKIVALNEFGVFDRIGVGFLMSLLPQDQLADLVYVKLEMSGKDITSIDYEAGKLNYRQLYKELTTIQSRLSNRSYDMRVTEEDRNMEEIEIGHLSGLSTN
jgi:DNA-directed RNA polymerase subunit E'/Rpb7